MSDFVILSEFCSYEGIILSPWHHRLRTCLLKICTNFSFVLFIGVEISLIILANIYTSNIVIFLNGYLHVVRGVVLTSKVV